MEDALACLSYLTKMKLTGQLIQQLVERCKGKTTTNMMVTNLRLWTDRVRGIPFGEDQTICSRVIWAMNLDCSMRVSTHVGFIWKQTTEYSPADNFLSQDATLHCLKLSLHHWKKKQNNYYQSMGKKTGRFKSMDFKDKSFLVQVIRQSPVYARWSAWQQCLPAICAGTPLEGFVMPLVP